MMRSVSLLVQLAILAFALGTAPVAAQTLTLPIADERVDASEFAIFPWDTLQGGKEKFDELRECGFNMAGFATSASLDMVHAAGLKCFVSDPLIQVRGGEGFADAEVTTRVQTVVAVARQHPAVLGFHVLDEPRRDYFPQVARWVNAFHAAAPGKIAFVNLLPDYGQKEARVTTDSFHAYMGKFVEQVKPDVLCYDHYALFETGNMRGEYFPNLETGRAMSLKTGLPFYHVVLGNAHLGYAAPTPEWFRFQVYTSLAYGVRGIGWFTYVDRERGNYRNAALDVYGMRSPTWKMLRDVNLVCHRLAPTLTKMKSIGVFHHGEVPKGCATIAESKLLKDVRGKGPFVIGEFEGEGGTRAVLIVNKSLKLSTSFQVVPKEKATISKVSATAGKILPMTAENDWLAPGQGMLLMLGAK